MADRYPYRAGAVGAREAAAARSPEGDPLAELARLIGQADPNAPGGRGAAAQPQRANYHDRQQPQFQNSQYQPSQYQDQQYQDQDERYEDHQTEAGHLEFGHLEPGHLQPGHIDSGRLEPGPVAPAQPSWMRTAQTTQGGWPPRAAEPVHAAPAHEHYPQDHYQQDYEQHPQHEEHAEYDDTPAFLRTARQHDSSRYDDVLYDQNAQNMPQQHYADGRYQDGYQDQADPNGFPSFYADAAEEEPRRRRGGLTTVVAVLLLAIVGTAGAYAYRSFTGTTRSGEPPVIKAEPGANKIVPPTQTADASGKIVDRIGGNGGGGERVLSREEQPIDISRGTPRVVFPPPPGSVNPGAAAQPPQVAPPQTTASNGALGDEPKRVRTFSIRPDQPDAVPQQTAPARPPTQARAQAPAPNAPVSLAPGGAAPARQVASAQASASKGTGGYMVQVTSQRSEADAQASYQAMQSKYPSVLGQHQASIRRADLGEKGVYYRAMIGPFAAAEDAGQLCNSLKSAGGQCVVQRN